VPRVGRNQGPAQLSQFFSPTVSTRAWSGRFATDERIVARVADSPIAITSVRGRHPTSHNQDLGSMAPGISHPPFVYGAYLLARDLDWNPLRLVYLMSSGRPYQVKLMQSELTIAPPLSWALTRAGQGGTKK